MGIYPSQWIDARGWLARARVARRSDADAGSRPGGWPSPEDIDGHLRQSLAPVLLARSRFIVGALAATCIIFFTARILTGGHVLWAAQAVRTLNLLVVLALLPMASGRWPGGRLSTVDAAQAAVLLAASLSLMCSGIVCTIEGDSINPGISVVAVTLGVAAFMPWPMRYQLALVLVSAVVVVGNQLALGVYARAIESITIATAALASVATVVMTRTLEQARRKSMVEELLRRRAEEDLRRANDELERRVHERTAKMREAMEELQAFNYSVSHDLRSPLRHINGMSQMLEDEYAGRLDDTAMQYLGRMKQAATRMGRLIDALLGRSRVGQAEIRPDDIDLTSLADTVLKDLRAGEPGRQVQWIRPAHLPARGDRTLVAVVLQHLLGNAWKFTRDVEGARIELGTETIGGVTEYCVRDNGVGFRMDHAGKLFENFQRLHGEEYEGTGIGLATVRRVVTRHGGSVRIRSTPGEGTIVCFRLGEPVPAA